jgi:hypothetical protein
MKTIKGPINTRWRYVFHGPGGVGKSTLAASAPKPLLLDIEESSAALDVDRYPFRDGTDGHVCHAYHELISALGVIRQEKHDFKTLIIDTIDVLQSQLWDYLIDRDKVNDKGKPLQSIEDYNYGRGYIAAFAEFENLLGLLDGIRKNRHMDIVLLAHSADRVKKNPHSDDYFRSMIGLQHGTNVSAAMQIFNWSDVCGFVCFDETTVSSDANKVTRAVSSGKRYIRFDGNPDIVAKTRLPLGPRVELERFDGWKPIRQADELLTGPVKHITKAISDQLERIGDKELAVKVETACNGANDRAVLIHYLNNLKSRPEHAPS